VKNATVITLVTFVAISLLLGSCATTSGQIADGRYFSPLSNFSVPIPDGLGLRVQEEGTTEGGGVAFHDDFGSLKSIFYLRLSPETLKTQNDPIQQRVILVSFLDDFAMPNLFKPVSPGANILHREHLNVGDYNAYFAIVEIPGGSTMFDVRSNKGFDTKRGLLIFVNGGFMYMLSSGENPSVLELGQPAKPLDKLVEYEKESLRSFRSRIIFK
jgi:hypothetical protein